MIKGLLFAMGLLVLFIAIVEGYHRSLVEVAGLKIADHAMNYCPSWAVGMATGAFAVGLAWWASPRK